MNRHARRTDMRMFRRSDLLTHCVAADTSLDGHPLLRKATLHWHSNIEVRKPVCIACKLSFLDNDARVGGYLFAMPVNVGDLVSTSVFCTCCWETLSASEVDAISTRVLRQLLPAGKFLDPR